MWVREKGERSAALKSFGWAIMAATRGEEERGEEEERRGWLTCGARALVREEGCGMGWAGKRRNRPGKRVSAQKENGNFI